MDNENINFKEIFLKSPLGVLFYDKDGKLVDANPSALKITGIPKLEYVKGSNLFDNPDIYPKKEKLINEGMVKLQSKIDFENIKKIGFSGQTRSGIAYLEYVIFVIDSGYLAQLQDITKYKLEEEKKHQALEESQSILEELHVSNEELQSTTEELQVANEELHQQGDKLLQANQTLQESEEKFYKAFHANPAAMTLSDAEGRYIDVNESYSKLTGYSKDELIGHTSAELNILNPEKRKQYLMELQEKGSEDDVEFEIETNSGEKRIVISNSELIKLGSEIRNISFIYDITERKKAEESLRESEEKFSKSFYDNPAPMAISTLDAKFIDVNESYSRLTGYSKAELIGHTSIELNIITPEERERYLNKLEKGSIQEMELELTNKSGKEIIVISKTELLKINNENRIISFVYDITERKKAENVILEAKNQVELERQRLETILETSPAAIIIIEASNGEISYINKRAKQIYGVDVTGLDLANAISKVKSKRIDGSEYPVGEGPSGLALKGQEVHDEEMILERPDGTTVPISGSTAPIFNSEGKVIAAVAIFEDITERKKAESNLRKSETQFKVLTRNLQSGIALINAEGEFTIVNLSFLRMFNLDTQLDILNVNSQDWSLWKVYGEDGNLLHVDDHPVRKVAITGKPVKNQLVGVLSPGMDKITWMLVSAEPIFNKDGSNSMTICTYHDITQRKQAEEDTQRNIKLLNGINQVFSESLTCETVEEVVGKCLEVAEDLTDSEFSFIGEINSNGRLDDRAISPPGWDACTANSKRSLELLSDMEIVSYWGRTIKEEKSQIVNNPNSDPDGRGLPEGHPPINSFLGVPLKQGNKTIGMIALANKKDGYDLEDKENIETLSATFVEVLMRKKAEIKLKETLNNLEEQVKERTLELYTERQRLYEVLETLPVMICLLTEDHHVAFANRSFRERFGESEGRHCYEYCFGFNEPCEFCESFTPLKTGKPHHWEVTGPDGSIIDAYDFPFTDTDGTPLILEMDIDITKQKQDEKALKKAHDDLKEIVNELERSNQELQQFAYVSSHDLQEPLRMVTSYLQLLERRYQGELDDKADKYINFAVDGALRMQNLIDDLLAFSRVTTKTKESESVDSELILSQVLSNLDASIKENEAVISHDPLPTVTADSTQLSQVFQNLISNAIKFRGSKNPEIHISAKKEDNEWIFSVVDNGIGIDSKHSERIFKVFQRLHKRREYSGTGIGLAVVKRIIERHGGEVWVESEVGKGSTFYFTIPPFNE